MDYISFYQNHVDKLKAGKGDEYIGLCPFHEDHKPSFYINEETGQYYCQACHVKGNLKTFCETKGIPYPKQKTNWTEPEATFDYQDEDGELLYQACRFPGKEFKQRRPDGNGKWIYQVKGIRRVPYRLPELLKADPVKWVFIPEGEKHCDRLYSLGLIATCNIGGAEKWTSELSPYLKDRKVCILPDNDDPGQRHGQKVAHSLCLVAKEVRVLNLPGLKPKGDIINWLDDSGSVNELLKLCHHEKPWKPTGEQKTSLPLRREPVIRTLHDLGGLELPEIKWIVPDLIPQGLTILAGKPKCGKSWLVLNILLAVATGGKALGSFSVEKGDVLYLALEDTERRLRDRVNKCLGPHPLPKNFHYCNSDWGRLPDARVNFEKFLDEHKDTRLIVVDTLQKIREPGKSGTGVYEQDYEAISILKTIADKYNVAVIVVHHQRKATSGDIYDTISGSLGITGSADTIAILRKESKSKMDAALFVKGRDVDEIEKALQFDPNIGTWILMGDAEEYNKSDERQEIINLLRENEKSMTSNEIAKRLGKKVENIKHLLWNMNKAGEIIKIKGAGFSVDE
jgi:hypothetical protein